ncbi:MAG: hypothetical protein B7Z58_03625 [Acidiphilium sp. 37-64-53]|nr:MAG: hypothetical protein B7Z58_03625 [Acidiphilium sp. 37-64-53]OZB30725.1 MAG: hypothetical protein B7X49_01675 [Acidiphilium sp. 34-64-41]
MIERCTATIGALRHDVTDTGDHAKLLRAVIALICAVLTRLITLLAESRDGTVIQAPRPTAETHARPKSPSKRRSTPSPTRKSSPKPDLSQAEPAPTRHDTATQTPIATPTPPNISTPHPAQHPQSAAGSIPPDIPKPRSFHRPPPLILARPNCYDIEMS